MGCIQAALYHVIPSSWLMHVIHSNLAMQSDTLKMFNCMWYLQTVLYHVITSNCFIPCDIFELFILCDTFNKLFFRPCDAFNLFYTMWYLQTVSCMWYLQTVVYHVIPSNCFMPCDTFKLFYIMWYIQTVVCHVIHSNCLIPCDTC